MKNLGFPWFGQFAIPSALSRQVHDDRASLHALDHILGNQQGGFFSGNHGRGDDDVDFLGLLGKELHLRIDELLAHHFGVSTGTGPILLETKFEELATQAFHLFLHCGTGIESAYDGTHVAGRPDGRQTGNPRTDHKNFGGRNLAGGRDLPREKSAEPMRSLDHGAVTRDVGHGAQGVHGLGPGNSRHAIHTKEIDLLLTKSLEQVLVAGRVGKADQACPFADHGRLFDGRWIQLEKQIRLVPDLGSIRHDGRAGRLVGRIREICRVARPGFHSHVIAKLGERSDVIGGNGNAFLRRVDFFGNTDVHMGKGNLWLGSISPCCKEKLSAIPHRLQRETLENLVDSVSRTFE